MGVEEKLIEPGSVLEGPFWPERVRVISSKRVGTGMEISGVGLESDRCYSRIFTESDLIKIKKVELRRRDFSGDS